MKKTLTYLVIVIGFVCSCASPEKGEAEATANENLTNRVLLSTEVIWQKLNPARGDASPQAGTLWGDRKGEVSTGFLAKFVDGFSSPPHIHNVTYRAVVISGLVHNDDPEAENMWMPAGSFWTQPAGEAHITSAQGEEVMALVEIDRGPYLVKPTTEAHDNGERPVNIDASNIVWMNSNTTSWIEEGSPAKISFLLESNDNLKSLFVKLPSGYDGKIESNGSVLHGAIISGEVDYTLPQTKETKTLTVGSYFGATDTTFHPITNSGGEAALLYIRTNGDVRVK